MRLKCPACGKKFTKTSPRHTYCSRKCFKEAYGKINRMQTYPDFACPACGLKTGLDFSPKIDKKKWASFRCPFCDYEIRAVIKEDEEML